MTQNKRFFSLFLTVILVFGLIPAPTFADAYAPLANAVGGNYTITAVDSIYEISGGTIVINNGTLSRQEFMPGLTVADGTSYKLVSSANYLKFTNAELTFAALTDKDNLDVIVNNDVIIAYIPEEGVFPATPNATNVAIYKIKTTATTNIINNGKLRFGDGSENSINSKGGLQQPFYFNEIWKQLTYSSYPLNYAISLNGTPAISDEDLSNLVVDYTSLVNGSGVATATGDLTVDGKLIGITNRYELAADSSYIKIKTTVENKSGGSIENVKYWAGTQDDYVGGTDGPSKIKGNLVAGAFVDLTAMNQQAKALKIYTGSESVLFFSTHPSAEMILNEDLGFENIISTDPRTSDFSMTGDNSYGMLIPLGTIASGQSNYFEWYYAAGSAADITTITEELDEEANTASNDATLLSLVPSTGSLTPAFDPATVNYSFSVANAVTTLNFTATKNQAAATMTLNAQAITSGVASQDVSLNVGTNTIVVLVTAEDTTTTKTYTITVTRAAPAEEPTTEAATEPATEAVIVVVNGVEQKAGTEVKTTEGSQSVVTVQVNNTVIENKIDEAIKSNPTGEGNTFQIPVSDLKSDIAKVELTGDIIKKLEDNTFDVSIKRDAIEYIIPANEFTIENVANQLGVLATALKDIKIEIRITNLDSKITEQYELMAKENGAELIFPPVSFDIIAATTKTDGTKSEVALDTFTNYVSRVMEIPAGVDPSKITTGIVFNADGTYNHVPTNVFQLNGKWYAELNSLTNSDYSIVWNPVEIASVSKHWSKLAVNDMASRLVVFSPETFNPEDGITRGVFAEYLVRALGLYRENTTFVANFKDVSETNPRAIAIYTAQKYNLMTGYSNESFEPDSIITREEAFAALSRALEITKLEASTDAVHPTFNDIDQVSPWATDYVHTLLMTPVVSGKSNHQLDPKAEMTYAEAAASIRSLLTASNLINN